MLYPYSDLGNLFLCLLRIRPVDGLETRNHDDILEGECLTPSDSAIEVTGIDYAT